MSRHIGITGVVTSTVYRAVAEWRTRGGAVQRNCSGVYERPGPARGIVTRRLREWTRHLADIPEETVVFDAWVEPVTVTNHPGVRYVDGWMAPEDDRDERLKAISAIASAMEDGPGGDSWKLAHAIRRLADGDFSVDRVREWLGEGWESL